MHWKSYKMSWQSKLKEMDAIVLAGDGRHDSMGHSAKYCAYSIFCCNNPINAIVDFSLVQVWYFYLWHWCMGRQQKNMTYRYCMYITVVYPFPVCYLRCTVSIFGIIQFCLLGLCTHSLFLFCLVYNDNVAQHTVQYIWECSSLLIWKCMFLCNTYFHIHTNCCISN